MQDKSNESTIPSGGSGLAKVMTTSRDRTKITHHSKTGIETACLDEVQNRFTQANDTPFLVEPLLLELRIIGTQWESSTK